MSLSVNPIGGTRWFFKRRSRSPCKIQVVTNNGDSTVSVISLAESRGVSSSKIQVNGTPGPLLVARDGKTVYVGLDRGKHAGAVEVIDANTREHSPIPTSGPVRDMAFSLDGKSIYLAMELHGLGKLHLEDGRLTNVDSSTCPEGLAITAKGELLVSYQCQGRVSTSSGFDMIGGPGHDPFRVFNTLTDSPQLWITKDADNKEFPNVGGQMSLSPDDKQVWENGNNACSSNTEYDFKGCPEDIKDYRGRGIINIIDTSEHSVIGTKGFVGKLPGSDYNLGASTPTFFPSYCHFAPGRVAVSTEQDVLIFDADSRNLLAPSGGVPKIRRAGNVVFSPDCRIAYVISSADDSLHLRAVRPDGTFGLVQNEPPLQGLLNWYEQKWKSYSAGVAAVHSVATVLLLYLIAFVSPRLARVIGRWPVLSYPLEVDVLVRKARSVVVRLYLDQLKLVVSASLKQVQAGRIVPLPLVRSSEASARNRATDTEQWVREFVGQAEATGNLRVAMKGAGGKGKSILIQRLVSELLAGRRYVPILLQGLNYREELSLGAWLDRVMDEANVPLQSSVLRSLPSLVIIIDGVSEVPVDKQEPFWKLIKSQFEQGAGTNKLVIAGRTLGNPDTGTGASLPWDVLLEIGELNDDVIKELGAAYLDPGGPSEEIARLPEDIRRIASHPTAFIVSHYVRAKKASTRAIGTIGDLYQEILDSYVAGGALPVRPHVVKLVLQRLVFKEFGTLRNRGLPSQRDLLAREVNEVYVEQDLAKIYGERNIPPAATFVDRLIYCGLLERVGDRYVFFHDSFEEWLLDEARHATRDIRLAP